VICHFTDPRLVAVCPTPSISKAWITTLRALAQPAQNVFPEGIEARIIAAWKLARADLPKNSDRLGSNLDFDRLSKLFFSMNNNLSKDAIAAMFSVSV